MMQFIHFVKICPMQKVPISIQPVFFIALSLAVVFVPLPWLISWMAAVVIHEIFHLTALKLCRFPIVQIRLCAAGAEIDAQMYPGIKMAICAMAGPFSGFLLLPVIHIVPRVAICGLLLSLSNLLPIYPMDGGRILFGVLSYFLPETTVNTIMRYIQYAAYVVIFGLLIFATVYMNMGIITVGIVIVIMAKKYLAKRGPSSYNMDKCKMKRYIYDR